MPSQNVILNPIGIDKVIARINLKLSDISWLTSIYTRAWVQPVTQESQTYTGKVYLSENEYYSPIPEDNQSATSVILVTSPERYTNQDPDTDDFEPRKERDIALIVSCNLKMIDDTKDYVFTEELKREIDVAISKIDGLTINSYIDEDPRQVFSGFNVSLPNLMQYPYAAFRFNCTVAYGGTTNC